MNEDFMKLMVSVGFDAEELLDGFKQAEKATSGFGEAVTEIAKSLGGTSKEFNDLRDEFMLATKQMGDYEKEMREVEKAFKSGKIEAQAYESQMSVLRVNLGMQTDAQQEAANAIGAFAVTYAEGMARATEAERLFQEYMNQRAAASKAQTDATNADIEKIIGAFTKAGKYIAGSFAAAIASVGAAISLSLYQTLGYADSIKAMSDKTGMAATALQEFKFAAEQAGTSLGTVNMASRKLSQAIGSESKAATQIIKDLGLSFEDLKKMSPEQQLTSVLTAMDTLGTQAEKTTAMMRLFGRSGNELQPLVGEMQKLRDRAKELGLVLSNEAINAIDRTGDAMDALKATSAGVLRNFSSAILSSPYLATLLENLGTVVGDLSRWVADNQTVVQNWTKNGILYTMSATLMFLDVLKLLADGWNTTILVGRIMYQLVLDQAKALLYLAAAGNPLLLMTDTWKSALKTVNSEIEKNRAATNDSAKNIVLFGAKIDLAKEAVQNFSIGVMSLKDNSDGASKAVAGAKNETNKLTGAANEAALKVVALQEALGFKSAAKAEKEIMEITDSVIKMNGSLNNLSADQVQKISSALEAIGTDGARAVAKVIRETHEMENSFRNSTKEVVAMQKEIDKWLESETKGMEEAAAARKAIDDMVKEGSGASAITSAQQQMTAMESLVAKGINPTIKSWEGMLGKLDDLIEKYPHATAEIEAMRLRLVALNTTDAVPKETFPDVPPPKPVKGKTPFSEWSVDLAKVLQQGESLAALFSGKLQSALRGASSMLGGLGSLFGKTKQADGSMASSIGQLFKGQDIMKNLSSAIPAIAAMAGPVMAAVGAWFEARKISKIGKEVGAMFGTSISKEMSKQISEQAKKLGLNVSETALLNIPKIAEDSGKSIRSMGSQISDLFGRIKSGALPSAEGMKALGETFSKVTEEAKKLGIVGDRTTVSMLKMGRETGLLTEEMKAYSKEQVQLAVSGAGKIADGLSKALGGSSSKEAVEKWFGIYKSKYDELKKLGSNLTDAQQADMKQFEQLMNAQQDKLNTGKFSSGQNMNSMGKDAATLFMGAFNAAVAEEGWAKATESMREGYEKMKGALGGDEEAMALLAPFERFVGYLENEVVVGLLTIADGTKDVITGLANAGYLSTEQFTAATGLINSTYEKMKVEGVLAKDSLLAIAPALGAAISAAQQYGIPLDQKTLELKAAAEAAGVKFPIDPLLQVRDVLLSIAEALGAKIPESARSGADAVSQSAYTSADAHKAAAEQSTAAWQAGLGSAFDGSAESATTAAAASAAAAVAAADISSEAWSTQMSLAADITEAALVNASGAIKDEFKETAEIADMITEGFEAAVDMASGLEDGVDAAATAALSLSNIIGQMPQFPRPPGGGYIPDPGEPAGTPPLDYTAATGFYSPSMPRGRHAEGMTTIGVHPGEEVSVIPKGASRQASAPQQASAEPPMYNLTVYVGNERLYSGITKASRSGEIRIHEDAVRKW